MIATTIGAGLIFSGIGELCESIEGKFKCQDRSLSPHDLDKMIGRVCGCFARAVGMLTMGGIMVFSAYQGYAFTVALRWGLKQGLLNSISAFIGTWFVITFDMYSSRYIRPAN